MVRINLKDLLPQDFPPQPEFKSPLSYDEMTEHIKYLVMCQSEVFRSLGGCSWWTIELLKQILKYSAVLIQHHGLWGGDKRIVLNLRQKIDSIRTCTLTNIYPRVIYKYCNVLEKAMEEWEAKEAAPKSDINYQICSQKLRACGVCEDLVGYISEFSMRDTQTVYMSEKPYKRNGLSVHWFWIIDEHGRKKHI